MDPITSAGIASPPADNVWDVVVLGAGPAGSATAGLLAQQGARVLVLEKEHFPRFHIGESLLPASLGVLRRLGVEPDASTFVYKRGARFVCEATGRSRTFAFDEALAGTDAHAWHVDRARFDTLLRDRARAAGATVVHGETVVDAGVEAERVYAHTKTERHLGRFLVDATGQARLCASIAKTVEPYRNFGASAVFTHYAGLSAQAIDELAPDFDIRILVREDGWGWIIPLAGERLSVGLVTTGRATKAMLDVGLLEGPTVKRLTQGARRLETHVVGNYSFRNAGPTGPRRASVGDAACFLDPVFSSGVTLALRAAESLADTLAPALREGREGEPTLLDEHRESMERAYRTFAGLIDRFYNTKIVQGLFLAEVEDMPGRAGVMSVLAGDVWRHDNPFQDMLLNARRRPPIQA
jgi:flavin-dependent dehydrogenase